MARLPASIRSNNPGAMWGGSALTKKWGATSTEVLNDGKGQGNNIAHFPDKVSGAAAQFDLWLTSKHYKGKPLSVALRTWSGGNNTDSYVKFMVDRVPGLTPNTKITKKFLASPSGILFMKAQAWHEAGRKYPMSDKEWAEAQAKVFGEKAPPLESRPVPVPVPTPSAAPSSTPVQGPVEPSLPSLPQPGTERDERPKWLRWFPWLGGASLGGAGLATQVTVDFKTILAVSALLVTGSVIAAVWYKWFRK